jgi:hypothetical protein
MQFRVLVFSLLSLVSTRTIAADKPSYKSLMRIPVQLFTAQGTTLEIGQYELEAKPENDEYVLTFFSAGKVRAVVKPLPDPNPDLVSAHIPLVGTHYLRSSTEPVLTGEERRFSKTGATQYEEENRDWKATLRVYKSSAGNAAIFLLQIRGEHGQWNRTVFRIDIERNGQEH